MPFSEWAGLLCNNSKHYENYMRSSCNDECRICVKRVWPHTDMGNDKYIIYILQYNLYIPENILH